MDNHQLLIGLKVILVVLLIVACLTDWRERIIPHWLNIAIALLAPLAWWAEALPVWPGMALQLGLAVAITAIFIVFQAIGAMGGGDVKLLGALALWMPWLVMIKLLILMSIGGGILTAVLLVQHKLRKQPEQLEIPYGIAISVAAMWMICEPFFNHFKP